ncbi:MAG: hypothetical protein FWH06_00075 [Oscillospiraceae bacterium]|nr:hypothetical protein [Oscillospiraceae bacterium]
MKRKVLSLTLAAMTVLSLMAALPPPALATSAGEAPAPKVAAYYDPANPAKWFLVEKGKTEKLSTGYEWAASADGPWTAVSFTGFDMKPSSSAKAPVFVRASGSAPSKAAKLTPANYGKPTKYKIDYKNEIIKMKKGDQYSLDGGKEWTDVPLDSKGKPMPYNAEPLISDEDGELLLRKAPTGKKPATENQILTALKRGPFESMQLTINSGKITTDMKPYEIWVENTANPAKSKWGKLPKINTPGVHVFYIRAKAVPKGANAKAASSGGKIKITYGDYTDSDGKNKTGMSIGEIIADGSKPTPGKILQIEITEPPESAYFEEGTTGHTLTVAATTTFTDGKLQYEWWHKGPSDRFSSRARDFGDDPEYTLPGNLGVGIHYYSVKVRFMYDNNVTTLDTTSDEIEIEVLPKGMTEPTSSPNFTIVANFLNSAVGGMSVHTLYGVNGNQIYVGANLNITLNWGRGPAAATGITSIKFGERVLEPADYTVSGTQLTILHADGNWFDSLPLDWYSNMDWRRNYTIEIRFNDDFEGLTFEGGSISPSGPISKALTIRDNAQLPSFPGSPAQITFDKSLTPFTAPGYVYEQIVFTGLDERGYGRKATTLTGVNAAYTAAYIVNTDGTNPRPLVLNTDYERDIAGSGMIRFRQGSPVLNSLPDGEYILRVISNNPPYNTVLEKQVLTIIGG